MQQEKCIHCTRKQVDSKLVGECLQQGTQIQKDRQVKKQSLRRHIGWEAE